MSRLLVQSFFMPYVSFGVAQQSSSPSHTGESMSIYFYETNNDKFQVWTGSFFKDTSLRKLGFVLQLGHDGEHCCNPSALYHGFTAVDTTGIHSIDICFCECYIVPGASQPRTQLLRIGWLPMSIKHPQGAFTFDVLDSFHLLTLQGKISAHDYYLSLEHKTENVCRTMIKVGLPNVHQ